METPVTVYREATVTVKVKDPNIVKRPRVQHIIKQHLQQKYLLCGFAIHAFIACPAYLYGIVVDCDREWIMRIWPAILYQAIGQICQSIILHTAEKCNGNNIHSYDQDRKMLLCATIIICLALTICGCLFSSAWITVTTTTQIIAIIIYGLFGGIGSSLIFSRTHLILEVVRPKEDNNVRKTIHLCGEAFCQLFLSFVFTSLRTLYGTAQTLVLMASLLINLIPLALLITRHRVELLIRKIPTTLLSPIEHRFDNLQTSFVRNTNNLNMIDQIDGIEIQQKFWRNPLNRIIGSGSNNDNNSSPSNSNDNEYHCNYMAVEQDDYNCYMAANINSNGVEIMEIIPEEDENISTMRSSTLTINNSNRISMDFGSTIMRDKFGVVYTTKNNNININHGRQQFKRMRKISNDFKEQCYINLKELFIIPLSRALIIYKLYPAIFLQSTDIFSYVMCLIVLPGLAVSYHQLKFAEIPFLFSLLAFPWMCFALMTPRFGNTLIKKKIHWHVSGCISKALALICISFSTSKLLLSVSSVLLGFGQAVSLFLQDLVIQNSMSRAQWREVKYPMCFVNGLLIMLWGILAHFIATYYGFQACVGLAASLYTISIIIWFGVYFLIKT